MSDDGQHDHERDVWRSPDGHYRLAAYVHDDPDGLTTHYVTEALDASGTLGLIGDATWRPVADLREALAVLGLVARQLDGDARVEEVAGC